MALIYREGNLSVHTHDASEFPIALVYDRRDAQFNTVVIMDILTSLPLGYEQMEEKNFDQQLPHPEWVCEAILSCYRNRKRLMDAWFQHKAPP